MGKSYKILNIAKSMINFYLEKKIITNKPKIIFIGLQQGEKIYEELILGKNLVKTRIKNILTSNEKMKATIDYSVVVSKLNSSYINNDKEKTLYYLKNYA